MTSLEKSESNLELKAKIGLAHERLEKLVEENEAISQKANLRSKLRSTSPRPGPHSPLLKTTFSVESSNMPQTYQGSESDSGESIERQQEPNQT